MDDYAPIRINLWRGEGKYSESYSNGRPVDLPQGRYFVNLYKNKFEDSTHDMVLVLKLAGEPKKERYAPVAKEDEIPF